jgi:hypothetical protein
MKGVSAIRTESLYQYVSERRQGFLEFDQLLQAACDLEELNPRHYSQLRETVRLINQQVRALVEEDEKLLSEDPLQAVENASYTTCQQLWLALEKLESELDLLQGNMAGRRRLVRVTGLCAMIHDLLIPHLGQYAGAGSREDGEMEECFDGLQLVPMPPSV